jgi:PREDICTED: similar to PSMD3
VVFGIKMVASKENKSTADDVEMKNIESPNSKEDGDCLSKPPVDADVLILEEIREHAKYIEKFVAIKEPRFMLRVMRSLVSTRKKLNNKVLRKLINGFYTNSAIQRDALLAFLEEAMDVDTNFTVTFKGRIGKSAQLPLLIELDVYFHLLLLLHLIDTERYENVFK